MQKKINSHQGWDWHMPAPRGGGRHATETAELWRSYAKCQSLYDKKCKKKSLSCKRNCSKRLNAKGSLLDLLSMATAREGCLRGDMSMCVIFEMLGGEIQDPNAA
ncbi:hypothetical protein ABU05_002452 [Escherichia fergusonii]|uniref:hypothetical protein n=1 Tax=Escherichia fergusonii TaxID=564 RepID=UPI0011CDCBB2|nr:hypothetical protein [Escherichia fergusonii]EFL4495571.1 hypothetical protein [Escherichia fergusonii]